MKVNRKPNVSPEPKGEVETNKYISSYSIVESIVEFFKIAIVPFVISTVLSLLTLFESEKWNPVLIRARDEFIQITGLKLSFYIIILLVGVSFIFYSIDCISRFIARFVVLISNVGFVINAVLAGVFSGIIFSDYLGIESNISPSFKPKFYFIVILLFIIFYGSTKVLPNKIKKDISEILEKPIKWIFPFFLGVALTIFGLYALNNEEWCELPENYNETACNAIN